MKTKRLSRYCLLLFMSLLVVCCREDELYDAQWGDYLYLKPENRIHIW